MNDRLETAVCPLCRSDSLTRKTYDFDPFRVVHCAACGLWYLSPRVKEQHLTDAYKQDAYYEAGSEFGYTNADGGYECRCTAIRAASRTFLKRMAALGLTGGRLLEVGCGYGYFLMEAKNYFQVVAGLDYSEKAVDKTRQVGIAAFRGGIDEIPAGQIFDVIVAVNVIEHVYQPVKFVQDLLKHLAPRGWLVLSTPMMNSFWRRILGRRWPSFLLPEHVAYYDQHTLKDLYSRCGISEVHALPSSYKFPLSVIGQRAGLRMPSWTPPINFWMPSIMAALAGRRSG